MCRRIVERIELIYMDGDKPGRFRGFGAVEETGVYFYPELARVEYDVDSDVFFIDRDRVNSIYLPMDSIYKIMIDKEETNEMKTKFKSLKTYNSENNTYTMPNENHWVENGGL